MYCMSLAWYNYTYCISFPGVVYPDYCQTTYWHNLTVCDDRAQRDYRICEDALQTGIASCQNNYNMCLNTCS
jgi:hypothetical protein